MRNTVHILLGCLVSGFVFAAPLLNGDFEESTLIGWTIHSSNGYDPDGAIATTSEAYTGLQSLGMFEFDDYLNPPPDESQIPNSISHVSQTFDVEETATNIDFYFKWKFGGIGGETDAFTANLLSGTEVIDSFEWDSSAQSPVIIAEDTWHQVTLAIDEIYRSSPLTLEFILDSDRMDEIRSVYVDDVAVIATSAVIPAPGAGILASLGVVLVGYLHRKK